jgi:cytochrome P450
MCALLLVAGNVTVRNLLTNSVWCLAEQDLYGELDESNLSMYVEEVLRYRSPIQTTGRIVVEDVTVRGKTIEAGNHIMCWLGSANRDRSQFDNPSSFKPDRTANQHLGFGHGIHYCLGAPLARLQAKIVLSELFDRWDSIKFAEDPIQPVRNPTIHGLETLPIEFETSS